MTIAPRPTPPRPGTPEIGRGRRLTVMIALIVLLLTLIVVAVIVARTAFQSGGSAPANDAAPVQASSGPDRTRDEDRAAADRAREQREGQPDKPDGEEEPPPPEPPAEGATGTAPARLVRGSISDADYPAAAIRAEAQGTTTIALTIGTDGRVTNCAVTGSSGSAVLDSTSCNLVQRRFRFDPAMLDGRPVVSRTTRRITWRLPMD